MALIAVLNYVLSIVTATENAKDLNKEQLFVNVIMGNFEIYKVVL